MIRKYLSPKQFEDLDNKLNSNVDYVIVDNNSPKKVIFETNNITGDVQTYEFEAGAQTPLKVIGYSWDTLGTPIETAPNIAFYTSYEAQNDTYTFEFGVMYNREMTEEEVINEKAKYTLSGTSVEPAIDVTADLNNWLWILIEEVPGEEVRSNNIEFNYDGHLIEVLYPNYLTLIDASIVSNTPPNDKALFFSIVGTKGGLKYNNKLKPTIDQPYIANDEVAINVMLNKFDGFGIWQLNQLTLGLDESLPLDTHTCTLAPIGNGIYSISGTVPKTTDTINDTTHPNGFKFYINGIEVGTAIW